MSGKENRFAGLVALACEVEGNEALDVTLDVNELRELAEKVKQSERVPEFKKDEDLDDLKVLHSCFGL